MRVLIIGGSGLLGSCFKKYCRKKVISIGRNKNNDLVINSENIENKLKDIVKSEDVVVHAAWETKLLQWEQNKLLAKELFDFSEKIFSFSKKLKLPFVFISSDQVYSEMGPHSENKPIFPLNQYGKNKKVVEELALSLGGSVVRLNYLTNDSENHRRGWVENIINMRSRNLSLELYENIFFSPCSGKFAAEVIPLLASQNLNEIFNLGCKEGISKAEMAENILEFKGFDKKNFRESINTFEDKIPRGKDLRMNSNKISDLLSIKLENNKELIKNIFS